MESNHVEPPYQDGAQPESLRWQIMQHLLRIEISHQPYGSCAPPSTHQVPNGAPCPSRTDLDRIQADHIAGNAYRAEWSLAADLNRALLLTKQARRRLRLQGTLMVWSGIRESNPAGLFGRQVPEAIGQSRSLES